jgi:hypothetical protein
MDNASFNHSDRIEEMCTEAEVKLVYLPPYSPDLNPMVNRDTQPGSTQKTPRGPDLDLAIDFLGWSWLFDDFHGPS